LLQLFFAPQLEKLHPQYRHQKAANILLKKAVNKGLKEDTSRMPTKFF